MSEFKGSFHSANGQFIPLCMGKDHVFSPEEKAEEILAEAKAKAKAIEEEAYKKGLSQGKEMGREAGWKEVEPIFQSFYQGLKELARLREKIFEGMEEEIPELCMAISKKIIHKEITLDKDIIISVVKEAIKNCNGGDELKIRVSPSDLELVLKYKPEFMTIIGSIKAITFHEDENISQGGCVIETKFEEVDATIESQLKEVEKALVN